MFFLTSFVPAKRLVPLVLWPIRHVRRMQNAASFLRIDGETRAKQKGRDECIPSRPTLMFEERRFVRASTGQSLSDGAHIWRRVRKSKAKPRFHRQPRLDPGSMSSPLESTPDQVKGDEEGRAPKVNPIVRPCL